MTPDQLAKLTPEEKRVKCAKACGWEDIGEIPCVEGLCGAVPGSDDYDHLPDYGNDLNACREMWMTLDREERILFSKHLWQCVVRDGGHASSTPKDIAACVENATASQRQDAFLLTKC